MPMATLLNRIAEFTQYAQNQLSVTQRLPAFMSTLTYSVRGQTAIYGYEWQTVSREGSERKQVQVPVASPLTRYHHAEAKRVKTANGYMYAIDWITTDVMDKYYGEFSNGKRRYTQKNPVRNTNGASLFTLTEAVQALKETETLISQSKEDYFGAKRYAYTFGETPSSHFSRWEKQNPTPPQTQAKGRENPTASP